MVMEQQLPMGELLGAYLSGDVTPEERAAVERLKAEDASLQELAHSLGDLLPLLSQGQHPVSPALQVQLRERIKMSIAADLKLDALLKKGELAVSASLSQKLAARLRARLPEAALPSSNVVTNLALSGRMQSATPSLRIYAAPHNPWHKRMVVAGLASAAAAALAVGLSYAIRPAPATPPEQMANGVEASPSLKNGQPSKTPASVANNDDKLIEAAPDLKPELVEAPAPPQAPQDAVVKDSVPHVTPEPKKHVADTAPPDKASLPPKLPAPDKVVSGTPENKTPVAPETPKPPAPVASNDTPVPQDYQKVAQTEPSAGSKTIFPSSGEPGTTTLVANPPTTPDAANDSIAAQPDAAVVGALRGGSVEAAKDGKAQSIKVRDAIASGSQIFTGEGRVALVLPGDGRLWANRGTDLTISFQNKNTIVTLTSGEVSYKAGGGGALSLNAGNISVSSAKGVDVKIEDGKRVVATTGDRNSASISVKNGKSARLDANAQAVATLGSEDAPKSTRLAPALTVAWFNDLVLPGEGASNNGKTPASDKGESKKPSLRKKR
jgi:hypothetical protein